MFMSAEQTVEIVHNSAILNLESKSMSEDKNPQTELLKRQTVEIAELIASTVGEKKAAESRETEKNEQAFTTAMKFISESTGVRQMDLIMIRENMENANIPEEFVRTAFIQMGELAEAKLIKQGRLKTQEIPAVRPITGGTLSERLERTKK